MPSVVVHRGSPEAVGTVVRYLQDAGIDAWVIDQPNFVVLLVAFGTYKSRVVVPSEQAQAAQAALARWSDEVQEDVRAMAGQLGRQVLIASLFSLGACALVYARSQTDSMAFLLAMVLSVSWLLAFLVLAGVARFRERD